MILRPSYCGQGKLNVLGNTIGGFLSISGLAFTNHFTQYGRDLKALTSLDGEKLWNDKAAQDNVNADMAFRDYFAIYEPKDADKYNSFLGGLLQYSPLSEGSGAAIGNFFQNAGYTIGTVGAIALENVVSAYLTGGEANVS